MTKKYLPEFLELLPLYEAWSREPALTAQERRSINSAIQILQRARA